MKLNYNVTELKKAYYKLAKEMQISMILCRDNEIEIYEESHIKAYKFAEEIHKINENCIVVDLKAMGMDVDVRGNTLAGSKSLYLVDEGHYLKLIGEEPGQIKMI